MGQLSRGRVQSSVGMFTFMTSHIRLWDSIFALYVTVTWSYL